jgi:hypothetical protein
MQPYGGGSLCRQVSDRIAQSARSGFGSCSMEIDVFSFRRGDAAGLRTCGAQRLGVKAGG